VKSLIRRRLEKAAADLRLHFLTRFLNTTAPKKIDTFDAKLKIVDWDYFEKYISKLNHRKLKNLDFPKLLTWKYHWLQTKKFPSDLGPHYLQRRINSTPEVKLLIGAFVGYAPIQCRFIPVKY